MRDGAAVRRTSLGKKAWSNHDLRDGHGSEKSGARYSVGRLSPIVCFYHSHGWAGVWERRGKGHSAVSVTWERKETGGSLDPVRDQVV